METSFESTRFYQSQRLLIAKGHLQDEDTLYWDNSQADRDRGYAWKLFCFNAD